MAIRACPAIDDRPDVQKGDLIGLLYAALPKAGQIEKCNTNGVRPFQAEPTFPKTVVIPLNDTTN